MAMAKDVFQAALATSRGRGAGTQAADAPAARSVRRPAHGGRHESQLGHTTELRTLTEITLLCTERPKPQKTGSAWMHLATLYRSRS